MKFLLKLLLFVISLPIILLLIVPILQKFSFEIKSHILNSIPRYPKAITWKATNYPGSFPDVPEIHNIRFEYTGDYQDVIDYYTKYFAENNFIERDYYPRPQNREKLINDVGDITYHDSKMFTHNVFQLFNIYFDNYNGMNKDNVIFRNDALIAF